MGDWGDGPGRCTPEAATYIIRVRHRGPLEVRGGQGGLPGLSVPRGLSRGLGRSVCLTSDSMTKATICLVLHFQDSFGIPFGAGQVPPQLGTSR